MIYTVKDCSCGNRCEGRTDKCATCNRLERRASKVQASDNNSPINKRSEKTAKIESRYLAKLKTWKRGKKCAATFPHECGSDLTCHHQFGRGTHFHDELAEKNEIPLTLDDRFWIPLCSVAHAYITEHSRFA